MRAAVLALLLLGGCAALGGRRPVIENRFAAYSYGRVDPQTMTIAVFSSDPAVSAASVGLAALSDHGQAALIEQTKGKPPLTITADEDKPAVVTLRNSIARHVVIAVRPKAFLPPGDRVDAIKVSLEITTPASPSWQLTSWTQASNGQTVLDLGKLSDTSASKATISTGIAAGNLLPNLTVGGETSRTSAREVEIRDTTDFDAAVDNAGHAWLDETAGWRVSLAHNLSMDAVATAPTLALLPKTIVTIRSLVADPTKKGGGEPASAGTVRLVEGTVYAPLAYQDRPICGLAKLTYRIRHVVEAKQAASFSESDDSVEFQTGTAQTAFVFSPPPFPPLYVLRSGSHVASYQIDGAARPAPLLFATLAEATAFRDWFRYRVPPHGRLGNAAVGVDLVGARRDLTAAETADLTPRPENDRPDAPAAGAIAAASPLCPSPD